MDILGRFIHIVPGSGSTKAGQLRNGSIIFPRYHQWDAVRRLEAAARAEGPGRTYLVQHSAGSGKSNTIAWLAHRLMSLHGVDDMPVLSQIINVVNERFGMQLGTADQLFFDQLEETWVADEALVAQARANDLANFRLPFTDIFLKTIVGRMDDNADIFKRILDEPAFQATVLEHYVQRVFERARTDGP